MLMGNKTHKDIPGIAFLVDSRGRRKSVLTDLEQQVLDRALALRIIGRIGRAAPTGCVMVLGSVRFERVVEALMPVGERLRR